MATASFDGLKVFSTTLARDRDVMGETITRWIAENPGLEIVDREVELTSDQQFHCLTIVVFYRRKAVPPGPSSPEAP